MTEVPAYPFEHAHSDHAASGTLPDDPTGDPLVHSPVARRVGDGSAVETLDYVYAKAGAMLDLAAGFGPSADTAIGSGQEVDG